MSALCELLPWDSDFFSRRIGRVRACTLTDAQADEIADWARVERVDCVYFVADPADTPTLGVAARHAFDLVDVRVTLTASTLRTVPDSRAEAPAVRPWRTDDLPTLRNIARGSHRDSRFYRDTRFGPERSADLFATWIDKSCHGYADAVFVVDAGDVVAGYITCHLGEEGRGRIGLVGIAEAARRRGCGRALVAAALEWFGGRVTSASVVTQGANRQALSLYQRSGFEVSGIELCYHRWFTPAGGA